MLKLNTAKLWKITAKIMIREIDYNLTRIKELRKNYNSLTEPDACLISTEEYEVLEDMGEAPNYRDYSVFKMRLQTFMEHFPVDEELPCSSAENFTRSHADMMKFTKDMDTVLDHLEEEYKYMKELLGDHVNE